MTLGFKRPKAAKYVKPATFPQVMIIGMMIFTVILLVQSLLKVVRGMKPTDYDSQPAPSLNPVRNRGVAAAFCVIVLCILYSIGFEPLGYVLISAILCAIIMVMIGKREPLTVVLVSVLVPLCMWLIFYKFLKVNIPMGALRPLRDLVDRL